MSLETLKTKVRLLIEKAQSSGGGTEEIENLIDESKVLGTTDETVTVTEKVEQLIDKAENENLWYSLSETTSKAEFLNNATVKTLPRMSLKNVNTLSYVLYNNQYIERIDDYWETENCTIFSNFLTICSNLKYVKGFNTSKGEDFSYFLRNNPLLEIVEEPIDLSSAKKASSNLFQNCPLLREVRFVPETIKIVTPYWAQNHSLSKNSIVSTFGGLSSESTGLTLTLSLNAVKKAFETSEGANDGDTSAEWLALKDTKPNWTITLS